MQRTDAAANANRNFILQQGLEVPEPERVPRLVSALLFQPRLIGVIVLAGTIARSPAVFAVLAAMLWLGTVMPGLNPFDALFNHTLGLRPGAVRLGRAPAPRRFAQGMAAAFATGAALTLASGLQAAAWGFQALLILGVVAVVVRRFCLASFLYHVWRGRVRFAVDTLPWRRA